MDKDQIVIDRQSLKAIAMLSRMDILKSLAKRRKMPSELSREVGLSPSTISEHLKILENAGLVTRQDTGKKWVYYSLTDKGAAVVGTGGSRTRIIVFTLVVLFAVSFVYILSLAPRTPGTEHSELLIPEPESKTLPSVNQPGAVSAPLSTREIARDYEGTMPENQSSNSTSGS